MELVQVLKRVYSNNTSKRSSKKEKIEFENMDGNG